MRCQTIPVLSTERLCLRAPGPQDADAYIAFFASARSRFVGGPLNAELAWRELSKEIGHWTLRGFGRWTVTLRGADAAIGNVGLWAPLGWPEPEIGWDIFEGFEGQGYAREAAEAARAHAYGTLGWTTAISLIDPDNHASQGLAQRLGCTPDGTWTNARVGTVDIWRHPAPEAVRP